MKRRWFAVIGAGLLLSQIVIFVAFGFPALDAEATSSLVSWMFVGVLFMLGGLNVQIENIEWYQFVGGSFVIMGITFGVTSLFDASLGDAGAIFVILRVAGGLSMVFIGVDWIRGGHYFEVSQYKPGPLLGSTKRDKT